MAKADEFSRTFFPSFQNQPFSLVIKPSGSVCNLNCTYCYYLEKENLYEKAGTIRMSTEVLEEFVKQYIEAQPIPIVNFVWQGGEPCLMGISFYKKAIEFQKKYANGRQIENALQTNGTLLNEEWCRFFYDNNFLIGISIDGPEELHDQYRITRAGKPTFAKVMRGINLLKKYRVEFNTLTVISKHNSEFPLEVYRFLKSIGSHYMQFLPVVERHSENIQNTGLKLVPNSFKESANVTPWSVEALQFGKFMTAIFDEWVKKDVSYYFIQLFDTTLANWIGEPAGVCMYAPSCGRAAVIEHNGEIYSCDHFVFPEYQLGNIMNTGLSTLMNSTKQQIFGQDKYAQLPKYCLECEHLKLCYGECPKKRFLSSPDGEYGLNYLCEGYKQFFSHVSPYMEFMANELKNQRSPANVMNGFKPTA